MIEACGLNYKIEQTLCIDKMLKYVKFLVFIEGPLSDLFYFREKINMIFSFTDHPSIVNNYLAELRHAEIQKDSMRFRTNMERIAELMGYEISKSFSYKATSIQTPLGDSEDLVMNENPVLITILRAGLAMHTGLLRCFDHADSAFVSAYRKHTSPLDFEIQVEYLASPSLEGRTWIISDPMLATGNSMNCVYDALKGMGKAKKIIIASVLATKEALDRVQNHFPDNTDIYIAAVDPVLTNKSYIYPGLGDAGDLAFGTKLDI